MYCRLCCTSLRKRRVLRNAIWSLEVHRHFGLELEDAIMLTANATGCLTYIIGEVRKARIESVGRFSAEFLKTLELFFTEGIKIGDLVHESTTDCVKRNEKAEKSQPQKFEISIGGDHLQETWQEIILHLTPNTASLFQAISLVRNQFEKDIFYPSPTRSPSVNRNVETRRLFSRDPIHYDNPGIAGGLMGLGHEKFQLSITEHKYVVSPYVLVPVEEEVSAKKKTVVPLEARSVLSHQQSKFKPREADRLRAAEVQLDDIMKLLSIVCVVSSLLFFKKYIPLFNFIVFVVFSQATL